MIRDKLTKNPQKASVLIDTCGLIDGRLLGVVKNGFLPAKLIIPKFIVSELQLLADGNDSQKRARARYGLDMISELQTTPGVDVEIMDKDNKEIKKTDDKLVHFAKKMDAGLYTTDFNLNKVARVEGIQVLNVNELSNSLRAIVLPGERIKLKIVQKGSGRGQGLAYLEDGTMVVVEDGGRRVGGTELVEITKSHQSDAGKMMFGRIAKKKNSPKRNDQGRTNR